MKSLFIALVLVFFAGNIFGQSLVKPESVIYDGSKFLVSDVGQHQAEDGKIIEIDDDGMPTGIFAEGLTDPKGMEIAGGKLYVTDVTRIRVLNLENGEIEKTVTVDNAVFLNDICAAGDKLYAGDSQSGKLYLYDPETDKVTELAQMQSPNGILYLEEKNTLLTVSFTPAGGVQALDLNSYNVTTYAETPFGFQDGITRDKNGYFYVSNWQQGSVDKYDSDFNHLEAVISNVSGPADIYYAEAKNILAVPLMEEGRVEMIKFVDAPSKPTGLTPSDGAANMPNTFLFYWNMSERAFAYTVNISKSIGFEPEKTIIGQTETEKDTSWINTDNPFDEKSVYYWYVEAFGEGGTTSSDTILFITKDVSCIGDVCRPAVTVYPLPAKEYLNVDFDLVPPGSSRIILYDVNGKIISEYRNIGSKNRLNMSDLSKGLYFLEIKQGKDSQMLKILK